MTTNTTYIAVDGKEFASQWECVEYENALRKTQRTEVEKLFMEHFSDNVNGLSDEMIRYITDSCDVWVYSFVPFDGWEKVLLDYVESYETCLWGVRDGKLEEGKKYLAFCNDAVAYIVDPEYIRENQFAKRWLKETEKERDRDCTIRSCSECLFCYCVLNEEGIVSHWSCTMDNRLRTKDILARHKKCPIMDKGE